MFAVQYAPIFRAKSAVMKTNCVESFELSHGGNLSDWYNSWTHTANLNLRGQRGGMHRLQSRKATSSKGLSHLENLTRNIQED